MTIKLKKIKAGEYVYTGSKYVKQFIITKFSTQWNIKSSEESYHTSENILVYVYDYCYGLDSVKSYIESFDAGIDYAIAQAKDERLELEDRQEKQNNLEDEYQISYPNDLNYDNNLNLLKKGDMTEFVFAALNKNCTIGEYVYQCNHENARNEKCKIQKVLEVPNKEYDHMILNLMDLIEKLDENSGGSQSDDKFPDCQLWELSKDDLKRYRETCYILATLVRSDNRRPFVINAEGHTYARYVGLC